MSNRKILFVSLFLLIALVGYSELIENRMQKIGLKALKKDTKIIDFELDDVGGTPVKLSSYKGKVVFLNFWATWCPPCRDEMPSMQKLYDKFKNRGLEIVAVDLQEDVKSVKAFLEKYSLTFTVLLDKAGKIGAAYGARSIPTTYIIDRESNVIGGAVGGRDWYTPEVIEFFEVFLDQK
jgi:peroxiredoxin